VAPPLRPLLEDDVDPDPVVQFRRWFAEAEDAGELQPDAMVVATATPAGDPNARAVLLRGVDDDGFRFFTNFDSAKGRELSANPRAACLFHWRVLQRQVRARGRVERVDDDDADAYWNARPLASRVSAWASVQSAPIGSRPELDARGDEVARRFGDDDVPRPEFWGGYKVVIDELELWQHRDDRFHDRLRYTRDPAGGWRIERLQP
jgi:pyridoxamine 5'-phosphate oxidase